MKKRNIMTVVMAMVMVLAMSMTALAAGWQQNTTGWWWQNDDGTWPANTWQWIDGNNDGVAECYYFGNDGYMLANATTPDGYIVNESGAWTVNGIVQTKALEVNAPVGNTVASSDSNGSVEVFDVAGYGYTNGISNLLFEAPFMTREELAELFGGERKIVDGDNGAVSIYYNALPYNNCYVFINSKGNVRLTLLAEMGFDFYKVGDPINPLFDAAVSRGYTGERKHNGDNFWLWVERNEKTLLIDYSEGHVGSKIVSMPGVLV